MSFKNCYEILISIKINYKNLQKLLFLTHMKITQQYLLYIIGRILSRNLCWTNVKKNITLSIYYHYFVISTSAHEQNRRINFALFSSRIFLFKDSYNYIQFIEIPFHENNYSKAIDTQVYFPKLHELHKNKLHLYN